MTILNKDNPEIITVNGIIMTKGQYLQLMEEDGIPEYFTDSQGKKIPDISIYEFLD